MDNRRRSGSLAWHGHGVRPRDSRARYDLSGHRARHRYHRRIRGQHRRIRGWRIEGTTHWDDYASKQRR